MQRDREEQCAQVRQRLARGAGRVHMVGIGGVGMAGVACLLKCRGFDVSGCDAQPGRTADWLRAQGVGVANGHDPRHLQGGADWVVRTPAVSRDHPELRAAAAAACPVFDRGEVLACLLGGRASVAVAGTHGKTTTATFTAWLLKQAGADPAWCIGGESSALGGVAGTGRGMLVAEADESDGTLSLYEPDVAIVTNIEFDHMEHFGDRADMEACFRRFAGRAKRRVIYCREDAVAASICGPVAGSLGYGFGEEAEVAARRVRLDPESAAFELWLGGVRQGPVRLPVPGRHNVLNALAAAAAALEAGLSFEQVRRGLEGVCLPRRRMETVVRSAGWRVISDYAHHPGEIEALLASASRLPHRRLRAVFQPHRYTRTRALGDAFPGAFAGVDELLLLPVYAASEPPLAGGTSVDLYARFRCAGAVAGPLRVALCGTIEGAVSYYRAGLREGDLLLVIGAGDVERVAAELGAAVPPPDRGRPVIEELQRRLTASEVRVNEPLGGKTTLGLGGAADIWVGVGNEADLAAALVVVREAGVALTVFGGGSNLLVSDLGVEGICARLTGPAFRAVRRGETGVVAGAAMPLGRLLAWAQARGLGGLEFLEGIPGTVGGALRMNAGAWGDEIGRHVLSIRCLNPEGLEYIVPAKSMAWSYRQGPPAIAGSVVVEAELAVTDSTPEAVGAARETFARRRAWMRGLRSAGSVFRNPPGQAAGRLLEAAGLKGACIGGVCVSERHANVMVAGKGATASDMRALMERARETVRRGSGVNLDPEIRCVGRGG